MGGAIQAGSRARGELKEWRHAPPAAACSDLDGLLLDTEPRNGRAWSEAGLAFGVQPERRPAAGLRGTLGAWTTPRLLIVL